MVAGARRARRERDASAEGPAHQLGAALGRQQGTAAERVEQHRRRTDPRAHHEVPGQADARDVQTDPPADLHEDHRERDRNTEPAVEDVVEAAVARIVVRLDVAAEALLLEQELAEAMQAVERVVGPPRARPLREEVEGPERVVDREAGVLDLGDEEGRPGEVEAGLGRRERAGERPEGRLHQQPGAWWMPAVRKAAVCSSSASSSVRRAARRAASCAGAVVASRRRSVRPSSWW